MNYCDISYILHILYVLQQCLQNNLITTLQFNYFLILNFINIIEHLVLNLPLLSFNCFLCMFSANHFGIVF